MSADDGVFRRIKGDGLVTEVFDEAKLATLRGDMAIGHVRYTTAGGGGVENIQPFLFRHNTGDFAMAHNGNIVNSALLRTYLENKGSLFQSTSDSEILAHLIKKETRFRDRPRIHAIVDALNMIEGAFAFLIMTANRIYACRDKYGLRPLSIGRLGDGWVVSSETCAFDVLGAEFVRDVNPGEIVTIDRQGLELRFLDVQALRNVLDGVYLLRPPGQRHRGLQRPRLPQGVGPAAVRGVAGRRGHRGRRSGFEPERRDGLRRGERPALRDGAHQEQVYRPHLHPAFAGACVRRACG